jgi:site-specific DNA-cytosine methylase
MNVLSLFDGMSCGQIALERAGIKFDNYYASEIDKHAINVTQHNYPNTIQLGDINNWKSWNLSGVDLIMGGSPCQGFSNSGFGLNFEDPRSKLFFTFVEILKFYKPKYFLLENVKMKKEWENVISEYLGVAPILIDSSLVSAQKRSRLYWTNIPNVQKPEDKGLLFKDIVDNNKSNYILWSPERMKKWFDKEYKYKASYRNVKSNEKVPCLMARMGSERPKTWADESEQVFRWLTPIELERLQTVPDNYTSIETNAQRGKMLGNGWTTDIIAHIFRNIR